MKGRRRVQPSRPRCVLDSGGLSALADTSGRTREWRRWLVEHDGLIMVPTPILVEAITGDARRDAAANRILNALARAGSLLPAPDEALARTAGTLRFRARSGDGIGALVAACAVGDRSPCVLLTSDPDDLGRLLHEHPHVAVRAV